MGRNVKELGCVSQVIDFLSQSPVKSILKKGRRFQSSGLRLRYTPVDGRIIKVRDRNVRRREWLSPRTLCKEYISNYR